MRSGEEIQRALRVFASRWEGYGGTERGEAQTFLNEGAPYDPFPPTTGTSTPLTFDV